MDRTAAIAELPEAYATALRLRDDGMNEAGIAARLGIEIEAVGPLLRVAAAKLRGILTANHSSATGENK
jgi:DNA-directed RNA polymerase specialized sigma24 family protein